MNDKLEEIDVPGIQCDSFEVTQLCDIYGIKL